MTTTRRGHFQKRHGLLLTQQGEWTAHWRELSQYLSPRTSRFFAEDRQAQGNKRNSSIINSTATMALDTLVSGLMSGITNPSRQWFQLRTVDRQLNERRDVKWWLDACRDRLQEIMLKSNLYTTLPGCYNDLGAYGTTAYTVEDDLDTVVRYRALPLGSYCLGTNHTGRVDSIYRQFQMTVGQLVDRFGKDRVSQSVLSSYTNGNVDHWVTVVHAIEPNRDWDEQRLDAKYKRFVSVYWEKGSTEEGKKAFLRESGFDEFPVVAPRWSVLGEDVFGSSPGMVALGDVKMLQVMEKRKLQGLDKLVNPPVVGPVSLRNRRISLLPGDVTYVDEVSGTPGFRPAYQIDLPLQHLGVEIQGVERRVNEAFYRDLFRMISEIDRSNVTAAEIAARQEEKLIALGPVYMRLNDEMLDPTVELTFHKALAAGLLPPPPDIMQGVPLTVEYISVLAQTMRAVGVASIDRLFAFVGSVAGAFPGVLHRVNADKAVSRYADMVGVPSDVLFDDEQVQQAVAAEAQQQKAQQMMQMAQQGAEAAKNAGSADLGGNNVLSQLVQRLQSSTAPQPGVQ